MAQTEKRGSIASRLHARQIVIGLVATALFAFSWLFRFNDPGGSFAGLTDDHFFYLVRGWQILFGDLPVRDFVDHGAPLFYYVGAAVQVLFGRGTLSELAFSVTVLSIAAALTFLLTTEASGSIVAGVAGAAFHVLLEPRFYNYPKILVYAVAIWLLWRYADRPTVTRIVWVAVATVVGFLFRHDHGVFVGLATATLLLAMTDVGRAERIRHGAVYLVVCAVLVAPYLLFIQVNGGVASYFRQASAWAERDRDRAPVVWPGLFGNPDGVSAAASRGEGVSRLAAVVADNYVAWIFYLEIALPVFALLILLMAPAAARTGWPRARAKLVMVAVLALVLDAGFLRSPLEARIADPSVPLAILAAWLLAAAPVIAWRRQALAPAAQRHTALVRVSVVGTTLAFTVLLAVALGYTLPRRLEKASFGSGGKPLERAAAIADQLRREWQLEAWLDREDRPELTTLAIYLNECTAADDRVLVQGYVPQVLAMSRRAFAGGHADLRPGFFKTQEAQDLTVSRLGRQRVPVILLETGDAYANFRKSFPTVMKFIDQRYTIAGSRVLDDRFGVTLFVRRDLTPRGEFAAFGWPCYGDGQVHS